MNPSVISNQPRLKAVNLGYTALERRQSCGHLDSSARRKNKDVIEPEVMKIDDDLSNSINKMLEEKEFDG